MNVVLPFGFFGAGNIGDEAMLQAFASLIARYHGGLRVWVASRSPSHTARVVPSFKYYRAFGFDLRRHWAQHRAKGYALVGDTPIMDTLGAWPLSEVAPLVCAAHDQRKPVVAVGIGTERLEREESRRVVSEILAPRVQHWTVRSERDKERLATYGVDAERVTVAADLAWMLAAVPSDFGRKTLSALGLEGGGPLVGVNLTNEEFVRAREPRLFEKIGLALDALAEKYEARILFFANEVREDESFDAVANRRALACMKHRERAILIPNHYWTPQQMLALIGSCHLTISMRYHFCLFSALQSVPFIAVKRSDKLEDLCWDLNWGYGLSLAGLSVPTLLEMSADITARRASLVDRLQERVEVMRKRALRNNVALEALVSRASALST
jgi:polysaccharide pyruvyl transferase WcaK-like protein